MMPMPQLGYQNSGSMYGMLPVMQMNPMANMFGGSMSGSQSGGFAPPPAPALTGGQRPLSTFSLATTANLYASQSNSTDPTDEELFNALRHYLSTQDLMTVTKKSVFIRCLVCST